MGEHFDGVLRVPGTFEDARPLADGEVVVRIRPVRGRTGEIALRFEVRDTLAGFADDARHTLVDAVMRGDKPLARRRADRLGLGAALSEHLAKRLKSDVVVERALDGDEGYSFVVMVDREELSGRVHDAASLGDAIDRWVLAVRRAARRAARGDDADAAIDASYS